MAFIGARVHTEFIEIVVGEIACMVLRILSGLGRAYLASLDGLISLAYLGNTARIEI